MGLFDGAAQDSIRENSGDGCWRRRLAAVRSAKEKKFTEFIPQLRSLALSDRDWDVREAAVESLGVLGDKDLIPFLEGIENSSKYENVRDAAHTAIDTIQRKKS